MPREGRPPKPVEVKRRLGNPGQRPLPNPITAIAPYEVITGTVEPRNGEELVQALLAAGAAAWIGSTDQLATLRLVQEGWDAREHLRSVLAEHGWSYSSTVIGGGLRWYPRPEAQQLADLEKRLTTWLSQLGLNPADRGRLGLAQVKAKSKLEEIRERHARLVGRPAG